MIDTHQSGIVGFTVCALGCLEESILYTSNSIELMTLSGVERLGLSLSDGGNNNNLAGRPFEPGANEAGPLENTKAWIESLVNNPTNNTNAASSNCDLFGALWNWHQKFDDGGIQCSCRSPYLRQAKTNGLVYGCLASGIFFTVRRSRHYHGSKLLLLGWCATVGKLSSNIFRSGL